MFIVLFVPAGVHLFTNASYILAFSLGQAWQIMQCPNWGLFKIRQSPLVIRNMAFLLGLKWQICFVCVPTQAKLDRQHGNIDYGWVYTGTHTERVWGGGGEIVHCPNWGNFCIQISDFATVDAPPFRTFHPFLAFLPPLFPNAASLCGYMSLGKVPFQ